MLTPATKNKDKNLLSKTFLQSGNPLPIVGDICFKHPTVQEVIDIDKEHFGVYSEDIYYSMISLFLTDPYTYMVFLDDHGIDYESTTSFAVFLMLFDDYMQKYNTLLQEAPVAKISELQNSNIYIRAFKFFLGVDNVFITKDTNGDDVLAYGDGKFLMNSNLFDYVTEFVKKVNGIPEIDKINPEDEYAKRVLIDDEREELKKRAKKKDEDKKGNKDRLGNLISSITWACNGGITPFNRGDLHMYDLVEGVHRMDKLLKYNNTMYGYYNGTVDRKKLNLEELHWSS